MSEWTEMLISTPAFWAGVGMMAAYLWQRV